MVFNQKPDTSSLYFNHFLIKSQTQRPGISLIKSHTQRPGISLIKSQTHHPGIFKV